MVTIRTFAAVVALLLAACAPRPELNVGEGCSINTDCEAPLGCRLGNCRRICVDSRDCGAGLRCLISSGEPSGACQLPAEAACSLPSDCPAGFVCVFGTCTSPCVEDRDCEVPGAICEEDEDSPGVFACREPLAELCIYDSQCPKPLVCSWDQSCQYECREDVDCMMPRTCDMTTFLCVLPP